MKYWPVPNSYSGTIPSCGLPGSFWENRIDRYHCGVDIYAKESSDVVSVEDGRVTDVGVFTSPSKIPYWNTTHYVVVETGNGLLCRYAELGDVAVNTGDIIKSGELVGHVGLVLDTGKITEKSPDYVRKLKKKGNSSMLHFELWRNFLQDSDSYLGGNWFGREMPDNLVDPTPYLESALNAGRL